MRRLGKEEILEELNRLGIYSNVERTACFNEYIDYFAQDNETFIERFCHKFRRALNSFRKS